MDAEESGQIKLLADDIKIIKVALLGNMDKPGLVERVRTLETDENKRKWAVRALGGAVIASLIQLFTKEN